MPLTTLSENYSLLEYSLTSQLAKALVDLTTARISCTLSIYGNYCTLHQMSWLWFVEYSTVYWFCVCCTISSFQPQSASSIALDAEVQDALSAVQMSCFLGWTNLELFRIVCFGIQTVIQRVGMGMSVYHVDCGNIARRSYCDWNDAPSGLLLRGYLFAS